MDSKGDDGLFCILAMIWYLFSLIEFAVGDYEAAWKLVVLGSLFLNLYYVTYIFLRVREFKKFIEFFKSKNSEGSNFE